MPEVLANWSIIVSICHTIIVGTVAMPACHMEIAFKHRTRVEACTLAQMGIAQWKGNSKFADDEFYIGGYSCVPDSEAILKDQT